MRAARAPAAAAPQRPARTTPWQPTANAIHIALGRSARGCRSRIRGLVRPVIKFDIVLQHVHGVGRTFIRRGDDFQIFEIRLAISYCNGVLSSMAIPATGTHPEPRPRSRRPAPALRRGKTTRRRRREAASSASTAGLGQTRAQREVKTVDAVVEQRAAALLEEAGSLRYCSLMTKPRPVVRAVHAPRANNAS